MAYGMGATGAPMGPKVSGYEQLQVPSFSPEQMQLFKSLFSQVSPTSHLGKLAGGDQSYFGQLEAPALRQFGELQGNIASRFSGMGSGARRSSGFQNTINSAGIDLAERLQSQRLGLQQQAIRDLMGLSNQLLSQRPYENYFLPKEKPLWQNLLTGISPAIGQGLSTAGGLGLLKYFGLLGDGNDSIH